LQIVCCCYIVVDRKSRQQPSCRSFRMALQGIKRDNQGTQSEDSSSSKRRCHLSDSCAKGSWFYSYLPSRTTVILYMDEQINDLKRLCSSKARDDMRSVDCTFNLPALYLTLTVYKNKSVVRPHTNDAPLFLGPMTLHGDECMASNPSTVTFSRYSHRGVC